MGVRRLAVANGPNIFQMLLVYILISFISTFLARSACLPKGLYYVLRRVSFRIAYISVVVYQIITKFGEGIGW